MTREKKEITRYETLRNGGPIIGEEAAKKAENLTN